MRFLLDTVFVVRSITCRHLSGDYARTDGITITIGLINAATVAKHVMRSIGDDSGACARFTAKLQVFKGFSG